MPVDKVQDILLAGIGGSIISATVWRRAGIVQLSLAIVSGTFTALWCAQPIWEALGWGGSALPAVSFLCGLSGFYVCRMIASNPLTAISKIRDAKDGKEDTP